MNDINKTKKPLEEAGIILNGVTKIVKHKIKRKKSDFSEFC